MQHQRDLRNLPLLLLAFSFATAQTSRRCYYPSGDLSNDTPCNSAAEVSACCNPRAFCLDNGICIRKGLVSRGSCTDANWGHSCPQYCVGISPGTGMPVTPCGTVGGLNMYVCGQNLTCDDGRMINIETGGAVMLRSEQVVGLEYQAAINVSSTTVLRAINGSGADGNCSISGNSSTVQSRQYSAGEMAGVGVGVGIPLSIALAGAIFVVLRQRKELNTTRTERYTASQAAFGSPRPPAYNVQPQTSGFLKPDGNDPLMRFQGERNQIELGEMSGETMARELSADIEHVR